MSRGVAASGTENLSDSEIEYPEPPAVYSGSWVRLLQIFGPGAIVASVTVGTGETIFAPRVGAMFGYTMLWVVLTSVIFKAALVYSGSRYFVLTGEHPMEAWARFPGPRAWAPALLGIVGVVAFPIWVAALSDAVSSLCVWITGWEADKTWTRPLWSTGIIIAAMSLTVVQTYRIVERVSTVFLLLKIVFVLIAILVVKPDWWEALRGFFIPRIPEYDPWLATAYPELLRRPPLMEMAVLIGAIGGGVQDYVGYVGFVREKRWGAAGLEKVKGAPRLSTRPEQVQRGLRWLRAPLLDTGFSFGSVLLMTGCFMLLGAAVLNPLHQVPTNADLYSKQSQFLGLIHPTLVNLYKAGIFFAIFGAVYGTFELYTRSAYEPLRAIWPHRPWNMQRLRLWVTLYSGLGGLILVWTGLKTVTLATIISPFSGVLGCGLWCFAMIYIDRTQTVRPYRMPRLLIVLTLLSGIAMTALGGYVTARTWFP